MANDFIRNIDQFHAPRDYIPIVTAIRTYNLAKFLNSETSNTLVLYARARLWIISPHIQTLANVITLPMHLKTLFPGLRNMI